MRPARLPGLRVFAATAPVAEGPPRMDVAGFVGFAASGPMHRPVAVEDIDAFRDLYGPDPALARDAVTGAAQTALLGPSVEAFFRNGGRRAWVVRGGDETAAATLDFPLPGLVSAEGMATAAGRARSPGLWASALSAQPVLERVPLGRPGALSGAAPWRLDLPGGAARAATGDLLEVLFPEARRLLLLVVDRAAGDTITGAGGHWLALPDGVGGPLGAENPALVPVAAPAAPGVPAGARRLSLSLILWRGERLAARLGGLGFAPEHPRFWGLLPDDDALFALEDGRPRAMLSAAERRLRAEAAQPRFPLAGPRGPARLWLPLGLATAPDPARATPAQGGAGLDPGAADGLAVFGADLLMDTEMLPVPAGAVADRLAARQSATLGSGAQPRPLRGLHALWPVGEVSMVAVPDAVHPGWTRALPAPPPGLSAPDLAPVEAALDGFGRVTLRWTPVPGAAVHRVALAEGTVFDAAASVVTAEVGGDQGVATLPVRADCPALHVARVRAERPGEIGPWSAERRAVLPPDPFPACAGGPPDALSVRLTLSEVGDPPAPWLDWALETPGPAPQGWALAEGASPDMVDARPVVATDAAGRSHRPGASGEGPRHFRVRAIGADGPGPWSATLRVAPARRARAVMLAPDEADDGALVTLHRGLVRFCAARADAVALLSLPSRYRAADALAHLDRLAPGRPDPAFPPQTRPAAPLAAEEASALSYAALFHPWLVLRGGDGALTRLPPEGAAAGQMARRAIREGAWVAAANEPVARAAGLAPQEDDATLAGLIAAQINALREDPRGLLFFNFETLSRSDDLRPMGVRRLMILLRRMALREGASMVFEPHDAELRALARRRFEAVLSDIHVRGGLAGATPAASYRIRADETVNPPGSADLGRLTVEIAVAPSRPFKFLNIRLMQTGPQALQVTEAAP